MRTVKVLFALLVLSAVGLGVYIYSGTYPVGADVPHSGFVFWLLTTVRDRGIEVQSRAIRPPADLNDPHRRTIGAGQYAAMCSGCHLAPGYENDETREGLYPKPPKLAKGTDLTPAEIFWVIKHGLKMSGMPAWGRSHSNDELWDITAFVLELAHLTPQQYRQIVSQAPPDTDMTQMPMPGSTSGADKSSGAGQTPPPVPKSTPAPGRR